VVKLLGVVEIMFKKNFSDKLAMSVCRFQIGDGNIWGRYNYGLMNLYCDTNWWTFSVWPVLSGGFLWSGLSGFLDGNFFKNK